MPGDFLSDSDDPDDAAGQVDGIPPQPGALTPAQARASDGPWTLVDRDTRQVYRSGEDQQPATDRDFAYFGRLPRPDGNGSLIVFTGIHPQGSLGVIQLLSTRLAELYAEVGTDNFSAIVGTEFDHDTHEPTSVELVTPLHRFQES